MDRVKREARPRKIELLVLPTEEVIELLNQRGKNTTDYATRNSLLRRTGRRSQGWEINSGDAEAFSNVTLSETPFRTFMTRTGRKQQTQLP